MFCKYEKNVHSFFSCGADFQETPPPDYLDSPMGIVRVHPEETENVTFIAGVRQGYMTCTILRSMNMAQVAYKSKYCRLEEVSGGVKRYTDLQLSRVEEDKYGINLGR